jgi:ectoine hydroxylase-related dioxygenase (phytanoyl-CoA dioxygenase family)
MTRLTPSALDRYQTDGYVVPAYSLPAERVAELRSKLDELIARNPDVRPEKLVSAHIEGRNDEGVVGSAMFLELARDPNILDMVEQVLGPDIVLWGCQVFCKPGGDGMEVPMHQDGQYWPIRPLANCTVWVAIDESKAENGCLRIVPASHREQRIFEHEHDTRDGLVLHDKVHAGYVDTTPVDVELEPGQMSLHDIYLIHGSNPNRSDKRRAGVAIRYMPATSLFDRSLIARSDNSGFTVDFSTRPLWLLRGRDRAGNDFVTGHVQP